LKKVLEIADGHVGSKYGLSHPNYLSRADRKGTDCLSVYEKFCEVRDWAGKIDVLLVGGDWADGWNPKEHGDDRTAEEKRQVEIGVKLARMIRGSPKIYWVNGSAYHRGTRHLEEQMAEKIGAVPHPHYRCFAPEIWDIQIEDVTFNIAHPITISKSTWQYQSTPIAREEVLAILNDNPARVVLRFHAHYLCGTFYTEHMGAVCPGYQTKTPFQARVSPLGEYRIGSFLFDVDDTDFDWHFKVWKTQPCVVKA
jgi:hypothetical protein